MHRFKPVEHQQGTNRNQQSTNRPNRPHNTAKIEQTENGQFWCRRMSHDVGMFVATCILSVKPQPNNNICCDTAVACRRMSRDGHLVGGGDFSVGVDTWGSYLFIVFSWGALVSSHLSTLRLTFHIRALPAGCGHSIVLLLPADADAPVSVLAAGCWLLAAGAGRWLLAAGRWALVLVLLAAGCWPLVLLAAGCWPLVLVLLAAGRWLLAALPAAGWLLPAASCWLLVWAVKIPPPPAQRNLY